MKFEYFKYFERFVFDGLFVFMFMAFGKIKKAFFVS